MRKAMLLLAVIGLAGSLWAADPIIGTWKLNVAKSKFPPTWKAPKEIIVVYREQTDQIEVTVSRVEADGSSMSVKGTWPRQGGISKSQPPYPKEISYIEAVIEPGEWYVIALKDGKQVGVRHKIVSKDGKTMRETFKGTDDKGEPFEGLELWEKQ